MWHLVAAALALCQPVYALDNGVARTPPLGFNTWNAFGCDSAPLAPAVPSSLPYNSSWCAVEPILLIATLRQHCAVHEDTVKELVDLLVSSGLKEAGYTYFNLDGLQLLALHRV